MGIPDVLAMELRDCVARCLEAGLETEVEVTGAPGGMSGERMRVVRLRQISRKRVILTVAAE